MALHIQFPQDQPHWPAIESVLTDLQKSTTIDDAIDCMASAYYAFNKKGSPVRLSSTPFAGLKRYFENKADDEEKDQFIQVAVPVIASLALKAKMLCPKEGLPIIQQPQCWLQSAERG